MMLFVVNTLVVRCLAHLLLVFCNGYKRRPISGEWRSKHLRNSNNSYHSFPLSSTAASYNSATPLRAAPLLADEAGRPSPMASSNHNRPPLRRPSHRRVWRRLRWLKRTMSLAATPKACRRRVRRWQRRWRLRPQRSPHPGVNCRLSGDLSDVILFSTVWKVEIQRSIGVGVEWGAKRRAGCDRLWKCLIRELKVARPKNWIQIGNAYNITPTRGDAITHGDLSLRRWGAAM